MSDTVGQWYAHCHHGGEWFEQLFEPEEVRVAFIKKHKPAHEIETRLRLFRPVKGKLPEAVLVAWAECVRVCEAAWAERKRVCEASEAEYDQVREIAGVERNGVREAAWARCDKVYEAALAEYDRVLKAARAERNRACIAHADELDALHLATCGPDCPWTPENRTIFPKEQT